LVDAWAKKNYDTDQMAVPWSWFLLSPEKGGRSEMELTTFIQDEFDRVSRATTRTVDSLSQYELMWRPGPEANSIGLILLHMARSEDIFVQARVQGKPQEWESEKWYEKLNFQAGDTGSGYTREQVAAFAVPELKDLLGYAEAVRTQTVQYLKGLTPDGFDKLINMPRLGDITIGAVFSLIAVHLAQHTGEISYLRGLQRGMNK
jgi:uncharacterized damage-inducible protein DinB